jgi:hypothetical protein
MPPKHARQMKLAIASYISIYPIIGDLSNYGRKAKMASTLPTWLVAGHNLQI